MNTATHGPLYRQIASTVRDRCRQRVYRTGTQIPTERELMDEFDVSRVTIRKALKVLVDDAIIEAKQGSGYTVRPRLRLPFNKITSFSEDCRARGLEPESRLIKHELGVCTDQERMIFSMSAGARVERYRRLRLGDGAPLSIEWASLPGSLKLGPALPDGSLYQALEDRNLQIVHVNQQYVPVVANRQQARLLDVKAGTALMYIIRIGKTSTGRVLEYTRCWFRSDTWSFSHEVSR